MSKRLVDFLAERGVPPELRKAWPVAEKDGQIVWVWRFLPEEDDYRWIRKALELARQAAARGEVPVGAVVVRDGDELGSSANQVESASDATAHAELLALRAAQERSGDKILPGATLYVSLEALPDVHGRPDRSASQPRRLGHRKPQSGSGNSLRHETAAGSRGWTTGAGKCYAPKGFFRGSTRAQKL